MLRDLAKAGLTASAGVARGRTCIGSFSARARPACGSSVRRRRPAADVAPARRKMIAQLPRFDITTAMSGWTTRTTASGSPAAAAETSSRQSPEPIAAPEVWDAWGRFALAVAKAGIPVQLHSVTEIAIGEQITQLEKISKEVDLRPLRWSFMHMEGVTPSQIERMKKLNMFIALNRGRSCPAVCSTESRVTRATRCRPCARFRTAASCGVRHGRLRGQSVPPVPDLCFAVTGKMVGGTVVNTHTVSREHALIAHTRNNAYLFFRENDLGSIQSGRLPTWW